jgi:glutamate synthase (NADPH/NADH) small chain
MDAVRTAKRLGAERAYLIYRRSREEMPAREEEIHHAEEEGIEFLLLKNPTKILGDKNNWVNGIECLKMELGEPDDSGRRKPVAINDSEFVIPVQTVIEAVGQKPNPIIQQTTSGLNVGKRGTVVVNDVQQTSREGIFAGGDLTRGGATVILAMGDGKIASEAIHKYLQEKKSPKKNGELKIENEVLAMGAK